MGGAVDKLKSENFVSVVGREAGLISKKKNKKKTLTLQQRKNQAARGAQPLLQQTALSQDTPAAGAGTALL